MKRTLLLLVFLFTIITAGSAQVSYNRANHQLSEQSDNWLVEIGNDLFYSAVIQATEFNYSQSSGSNFIYRYDKNGVLLKKKGLGLGWNAIGLRTLDDKLVISARPDYCDVVPPNQVNSLTKLDTAFHVLFVATYSVHGHDNVKALVQMLDSSYVSFTDSILIRHTKAGTLAFKKNTGMKNISAAVAFGSNVLVSGVKNNSPVLESYDAAGNMNFSIVEPVNFKQLSYYSSSKIMGAGTDGKLYKLDAAMNVIGSGFASSMAMAEKFVVNKDSVFCLAHMNFGSASAFAICDTSFNSILTSSTTTDRITQTALALTSQGKLAFLSTNEARVSPAGTWDDQQHFSSLNVVSHLAGNNFQDDLEMVSCTPDSVYSIRLNTMNVIAYMNAKVKVKNHGSRHVFSFRLNCFDVPNMMCGKYFWSQDLNVSIPPGDSVTVMAYPARHMYVDTSFKTFPVNFCLWLTRTNGGTDKVLAGNEKCVSVIEIITGLKNNVQDKTDFVIAPNPCSNQLQISGNSPIDNITMSDELGRIILETSHLENQTTINTSELIPGIYFLTIKTRDNTLVKKIIHE